MHFDFEGIWKMARLSLKRPGIFFKDPVAHGTYNYEGYRLAIGCQKTCRAEEKCNTCKTENQSKLDQSESELPIELDCITYNLIEENQGVPTL